MYYYYCNQIACYLLYCRLKIKYFSPKNFFKSCLFLRWETNCSYLEQMKIQTFDSKCLVLEYFYIVVYVANKTFSFLSAIDFVQYFKMCKKCTDFCLKFFSHYHNLKIDFKRNKA